MATSIPITFFAPAEREPIEVVRRQASRLAQTPLTRTFLNASLNYLFLLNSRRQIVMASENVLELIPGKTLDQVVGLRPGEALGCIHAFECASGCGTSQFCRQCGTVRVILSGLEGHRDMQECRLTRVIRGREAFLELIVLATPLAKDKERYTLLTVARITQAEQIPRGLSPSAPHSRGKTPVPPPRRSRGITR
ncbi:MAG: hypothetical protein NT154_11870 [Verrucomicrobia bacterium]|nr:hypothetical protein [Verrucomicrobiota bacterium]